VFFAIESVVDQMVVVTAMFANILARQFWINVVRLKKKWTERFFVKINVSL
jgi:hypothetical protein